MRRANIGQSRAGDGRAWSHGLSVCVAAVEEGGTMKSEHHEQDDEQPLLLLPPMMSHRGMRVKIGEKRWG